MKFTAALLIAGSFIVASCSGGAQKPPAPKPAAHLTSSPAAQSLVNGRSIFLTGRDSSGAQITAQHKPMFQSCAACHGPTGSGGRHFTDGAVSADLRHRALVTEQKMPYTVALLQRAISTGIDNEGKPLDPVMPHWKLSKRDLHDVANYVFTQLK